MAGKLFVFFPSFALPVKMPEMLQLLLDAQKTGCSRINLACIIYAYTIYAAIFSNISNALLAFQFAQIDFIAHGHKSGRVEARRTWNQFNYVLPAAWALNLMYSLWQANLLNCTLNISGRWAKLCVRQESIS